MFDSPPAGLTESVYHNFNLYNAGPASDAEITNAEAYAATLTPSYSFTNTVDGLNYPENQDSTIASWFGADAAGAAAADTTALQEFAFNAAGFIYVPVAGTYTFAFNASGGAPDDAARVTIDGTSIAEQNYGGSLSNYAVSTTLSQGYHSIDIFYWQGVGGYGLDLTASAPNGVAPDYVTSDPGTACYVRGTRILAESGEIAMENLRTGDRLMTASGALRPVKWIGHRTVDCDRHPEPQSVWPICVAAEAFGPGLPLRDLWLSPAHAIAVGDVLIPVASLVNNVTIRQHRVSSVSYYHVELDSHDIILAENLQAESYLDTGNRAAFENGGVSQQLHPNFRPLTTQDFCRRFCPDGAEVDRTRQVLMDRMRALGYRETSSADLHVLADGQRIDPFGLPANRIGFCIPEGCARIELRSRSFIPAAGAVAAADFRVLGVCINEAQIDGVMVQIGDEGIFQRGWHNKEQNESTTDSGWRWTNGNAFVPPNTRLLVMQIVALGCYWNASTDHHEYIEEYPALQTSGPQGR